MSMYVYIGKRVAFLPYYKDLYVAIRYYATANQRLSIAWLFHTYGYKKKQLVEYFHGNTMKFYWILNYFSHFYAYYH